LGEALTTYKMKLVRQWKCQVYRKSSRKAGKARFPSMKGREEKNRAEESKKGREDHYRSMIIRATDR